MALNLDTLGLSATVTAQGISAPDYQTILETLTSYFRQIYGSDAYLEPDSKDGQMVALVALAVHDANNTAIEIYNSFSPTTAQAAALSSNVKINGITRKVATNSTADLLLTGTAGTTITNGSARDKNGIIWNFPASVAIGVDGTVLVTATCANSGSVAAMAGTITTINTPTRGWVSVLDVHPSGFYSWLQQHSQRHQADLRLTGQIKQFWLESGCVYGYRKIQLDLRDSGHVKARLVSCRPTGFSDSSIRMLRMSVG